MLDSLEEIQSHLPPDEAIITQMAFDGVYPREIPGSDFMSLYRWAAGRSKDRRYHHEFAKPLIQSLKARSTGRYSYVAIGWILGSREFSMKGERVGEFYEGGWSLPCVTCSVELGVCYRAPDGKLRCETCRFPEDRLVECHVCFAPVRLMKFFECGHYCCENCLRHLRDHGRCNCTICRRDVSGTRFWDLEDLKKDILRKN